MAFLAKFKENITSIKIIVGRSEPSQIDTKIEFLFKDPFDLELKSAEEVLDSIQAHKIALNFINDFNVNFFMLNDKNTFLHAKLYIFKSIEESSAIIGSSNFTTSGLTKNKELNIFIDSKNDTKAANKYFEKILKECESCTDEIKNNLESSYFYHSPKDIFKKIASFIPSDEIAEDILKKLENKASELNLYAFQTDAAKQLLARLQTYKIALLADPVGAGKTLVALALASAYQNPLIITPPKLKVQWESYAQFNVNIISYDEALKNKNNLIGKASLIIIDESHNFRNGTNPNKTNQYSKLQDLIRKNEFGHLLLLSATPINNSILDFRNQLLLSSDNLTIDNKNLDIKSVFQAVIKNKSYSDDYYKLSKIIVSRDSSYIKQALQKEGKFTPNDKPTLYYLSSLPKNFSFQDLIEKIISDDLRFCIYNPYEFLPDDLKKELEDTRLENLGDYTTPRGFIKIMLIKKLESSIDAFLEMLDTILKYHKNYLDSSLDWQNDWQDTFPSRLTNIYNQNLQDELSPEFRKKVENDYEKLKDLKDIFKDYKETDFKKSEKFQKLCEIIKNIKNIKSQKLLIFSESITTINSLTSALQSEFSDLKIAKITGDSNASEFRNNKNLFAPKANNYSLKAGECEIDILCASDVLSEGQNLQDCANLINWDIAFNPVNAIQRIGRISRIGSAHKHINIHHFFPDMQLEKYMELEKRLQGKIQDASTITTITNPFTNKIESKNKQYESMKNGELIFESSKIHLNIDSLIAQMIKNLDIKIDSNLNNGIFSIANDSKIKQNQFFCVLRDKDKKNYFCLFDLDKNELLPSSLNESWGENLNKIKSVFAQDSINKDLFSQLETFTNDYSDLKSLKNIFKNINEQLEKQIRKIEISNQNQRNSRLTPKNRGFKLICFLFINPNFKEMHARYN